MTRDDPLQTFCNQCRVSVLSDAPLNADTLDAWRKSPPPVRDGLIVVPAEENLATGQFLAGITAAEVRHAVDALTALQKRLPAADSYVASTRAFFASLPPAVQERMLKASIPTDGSVRPDRAGLRATVAAGIDYRDLTSEQKSLLDTMRLAENARFLFAGLPLWKRILRAADRGDLRLATITRPWKVYSDREYSGTATHDIVHIAGDERGPQGIPLLMAPIDRWESLATGGVGLFPGTPDPPGWPPGMTRPVLPPLDACPDLRLNARLSDLCTPAGISLPGHLRERRITLYTPAGAPPPRAAARAALNLFDLHLEGPPGKAFAIRNRPARLSEATLIDAFRATLPTPIPRVGAALTKASTQTLRRSQAARCTLSRALLLRCAAERKALLKGGETRRFDEASADFQGAILAYLLLAAFYTSIDDALSPTADPAPDGCRIWLQQKLQTPQGDYYTFALDRNGDR